MWPGLGQLYLRNRRAAAIFAVPALLVLLLLAYELRQGPVVFVARFIDPAFSRAAAFLVLFVGALRLGAVVHAFVAGEAGSEPSRRRKMLERATVVGLVTVIVVSHLGAGFLLAETSNAEAQLFATPGPSSMVDLSTPEPTPTRTLAPSEIPEPTSTPIPTPSITKRVTILLTGEGQETPVNWDSIQVVSYDPVTDSVTMISVPRDSIYFPLYYDGNPPITWFRIKELDKYAKKLPSPDSPYMTLLNEVQYLVGVHIDYYAALNITVFEKLIDMVGTIRVNNPTLIDNVHYDWLDGSPPGFKLAAGPADLNGREAMAYVRSRANFGDTDFGRSSRQQEVLLALLHKIAQPDQILKLPDLIRTFSDGGGSTNFPPDKVADYVSIGQNVPSGNITEIVLSPSYVDPVVGHVSNYYGTGVCLYNARVAALSVRLFGQDSLWRLSNGKAAVPANTCPPGV